MNIRKEYDYSALYEEIDRMIYADLSQIKLYCELGKLICARPEKGAAVAAAIYLAEEYPEQTGFSARNVCRMRDFYRMYENAPELLAQAMRLGWTQNVVILKADLTLEERAWYLQTSEQSGWSKLTLQKKIAEAAHLTEDLDLTSEMCYTEQDEVTAGTFAMNDKCRQLLFCLVRWCVQVKSLQFTLSIWKKYAEWEPSVRYHDPPYFKTGCQVRHVKVESGGFDQNAFAV